jgi:LysM repeat protein
MNEIQIENEDVLFALPKNMKQVGEATNEKKVYIEDYVYTYLHQYAAKSNEQEQIAFLVGERKICEGEEVLLIIGAIAIKDTIIVNGNVEITEEIWAYVNKKLNRYFEGYKICGWMYTQPGYGVLLTSFLINQHIANFNTENSVLFIIDAIENEETIFVYNEDELSPILGFYIYYEKNHMMHEYMLDYKVNKQNELEKKVDQVVKDYRIKEQEKKMDLNQKKMLNLLFTVSVALIIISIILGVGLLNNVEETNAMKRNIYVMIDELNQVKETLSTNEGESAINQEDERIEIINDPIPSESVFSEQQQANEGNEVENILDEAPDNLLDQSLEESINESINEPVEQLENLIPEEYVVQTGDNLIKISYMFYNTNDMVSSIQELNDIENPHKIYVGQIIILPQP